MQPTDFLDDRCVSIPRAAFSVAGFRAWLESANAPEHGRVDLCGGEVSIDMTPERVDTHTEVKGAIYHALRSLVLERDLGRIFPDGVTFTSETAELVTQPDGLFVSWDALRRGAVTRDSLGFAGPVDWLLEVVSPSSIDKDRVRLRDGYGRARVREYWLVDALGEEIDFAIHTLHEDGYRRQPDRDGWQASDVFGVDCRMQRVRDAGGWRFELHLR